MNCKMIYKASAPKSSYVIKRRESLGIFSKYVPSPKNFRSVVVPVQRDLFFFEF